MLGRVNQMTAGLGEAMQMMNAATQKMSQGARVQHEAGEQTAMTVEEMTASIRGVAENAAEMSQTAAEASSSVAEMAASVEETAQNASGLSSAADDTAASIVQTLASIRQVSENTEALSSSAEQTSSSITEMSATVKAVEQKAIESARLAEKVARSASEQGMAAAREAMGGMENIRATVETTADTINRLGKRSQEIGQILKVIDEVTDQTGLLALNAAILAAQAGEHGKGFAVVAEEIRELAERTAASTKEIANVIAAVQQESTASVKAMGKGLEAVESGVALVKVTSDVFSRVAESSGQSAEMARAIELTTAEQAKGVTQITAAAVNIAEQIEHIAHAMQEQQKGSERIAQAAEKMRDITRQMKVATQEQTVGGRQIAKAMEVVTSQAAQVARSTAEQRLGAQQIADAIARIQKITEDNVNVSVEMDMSEATLREKAAALQAELRKFTV
jgi:methyl-accepting chemotaxis protein